MTGDRRNSTLARVIRRASSGTAAARARRSRHRTAATLAAMVDLISLSFLYAEARLSRGRMRASARLCRVPDWRTRRSVSPPTAPTSPRLEPPSAAIVCPGAEGGSPYQQNRLAAPGTEGGGAPTQRRSFNSPDRQTRGNPGCNRCGEGVGRGSAKRFGVAHPLRQSPDYYATRRGVAPPARP